MVNSASGTKSSGSQRLSLYLINGIATVWEAQTAAILHCSHGISGLRAGTLPGVSQQNAFLGLPVTLTPEETAWCINTGIAQLIPLNPSLPSPSSSDLESSTQARINRIQTYLASQSLDSARKESLAKAAFEKGGEKARLKREARAKAKAEKERAKAQAHTEGEELFGAAEVVSPAGPSTLPSTSTPIDHPAGSTPSAPDPSSPETTKTPLYPHEVPSHPLFPHLTYTKPITHLPHPLFPFPRTRRDRALVDTFTSLHDRGYRIGLGPRFGGEYLVYPGDYLRYHAHFTSQVLVDDEPIRPIELVAWGRLGTGTKKAGLICCWDGLEDSADIRGLGEKEGERYQYNELGPGTVEFYSLEWANFG